MSTSLVPESCGSACKATSTQMGRSIKAITWYGAETPVLLAEAQATTCGDRTSARRAAAALGHRSRTRLCQNLARSSSRLSAAWASPQEMVAVEKNRKPPFGVATACIRQLTVALVGLINHRLLLWRWKIGHCGPSHIWRCLARLVEVDDR